MAAGLGLWLVAAHCLAQEPKVQAILEGHTKRITQLAFTADGKRLVSASWDSTSKSWDVTTGKELATFKGHRAWVWSVAVSANGKLAASGDRDGTIKLWEVASAREQATLKADHEAIRSLA